MTEPIAVIAACSSAVVMLIAWSRRPRPAARAGSGRAAHHPPWILVAALVAVATVISPALGLGTALVQPMWRQWSKVRRRAGVARQIVHDFPDALDVLVLSIRAGYLPAQAIVEVIPFLPPPLRASFNAVRDAMLRGERFADALGQLRARLGPIAQPLVDSLSAADRYGLPLAPVLERLSLEARQQRRRDADATARELPVRLAMPLVLCTLPSFVLLAIVPLLLGALSSLHT